MAQSVTRQWPSLPESNPESLALWARQITRLLQEGAIVNSSQIADFGLGNVTAAGTLTDNAIVAGAGTTGVKIYTGGETAPSLNLDSVVETSIVSADSSTSNKPLGNTGNWMVSTFRRAVDSFIQSAISRSSLTPGFSFIRTFGSGAWTAWVRMLAEFDVASVADVRSAAAATTTDAQVLTAALLETASAGVALTDAATVAVDWDAFINATVVITANRALGTPSNAQPGTWRTIRVSGNDATLRSLTFAGYRGGTATLTDISNAKEYLLTLFSISSTVCILKSTQAFP